MSVRAPRSPAAAAVMAAGAVAAALLLWSCRDFVPMWDGREYAECVVRATSAMWSPASYRCAGHISQSYVALLVIAQRFATGSTIPMLAMNALLLALGAVALHRIVRRVLPGEEHRVGGALVVAAFLVHPIVLGSAVQPGLDFGVLVFSLCALAATLEGRRWTMVLFGILLVFSKEPGVLVYGVIAALYLWRHALRALLPNGAYWLGVTACLLALVVDVAQGNFLSAFFFLVVLVGLSWRRLSPSRPPVGAVLRALPAQWGLVVPLVLVFGYMGVHALMPPPVAAGAPGAAPVVWGNQGSGQLVRTVFRANLIDQATLSVLALMLVVGFLWLPTLVMLFDLGVAATRVRARKPARETPGIDGAALGLVVAALLGDIWFLSRFVTFSNARYYLPLYPLALVVAYASLVRLGVTRTARQLAAAAFAVLLAVSAVRTVDPVSRALWGTFRVGEHEMLHITSLTGECCGAGRDQLVYNLEFTHLAALMDEALAQVKPAPSTMIVLPVLGDWYTVGRIDAASYRRTLRHTQVIRPLAVNALQVYQASERPATGWYFEVPYVDNLASLQHLAELYDISEPAFVRDGGYAMGVRRLRLRAVPATR